ncbi:hypothetical protein BDV93DRAFT_516833 [Ceratobasidium sp. AG-I]|nr:hypothetical protein BDV93DRAFT_516833 [Ceratobasidium sp. AG-I]
MKAAAWFGNGGVRIIEAPVPKITQPFTGVVDRVGDNLTNMNGMIKSVCKMGRIITHRVPIDDMAKLYVAFDKRIDAVKKVFVETKFSSPPCAGCPTTSRMDDWGK